MNDTDRSFTPPASTPLAATDHYVSLAADWYRRGLECTPTDLPDVQWCSLEGLAHTAGRCRETVSPAELVLRWRDVSLSRQRTAVQRPEPVMPPDELERWSAPDRVLPERIDPQAVEVTLSPRARLLALLAAMAASWVLVGLICWGVLALAASW